MPFGEYESFDDCVAKNSDKEDPKAYCASLEKKTEAKFELLSEDGNSKTWKVKAITVTRSGNGRLYTKEELSAAAETLSYRPLNLNHDRSKRLPYPDSSTLHPMTFMNNAITGSMRISDKTTNERIAKGEINKLSVEQVSNEMCADALCSSKLQYGMAFTGLALLESNVAPGDSKTEIKAEALQDILFEELIKKEDGHECPEGQHYCEAEGKCMPGPKPESDNSHTAQTGSTPHKMPDTQPVKDEAKPAVPGVLDDKIVFSPKAWEEFHNMEQKKLEALDKLIGTYQTTNEKIIAQFTPKKESVPSSPTSDGTQMSKNESAKKEMADWIKSAQDSIPHTFKLDKDEYLRSLGFMVDDQSRILGRTMGVKSEAITTATMPINYDRDAIFIPGGQLPIPLRQYLRVKPTGQGNGTVAFYTGTNATFGAITEGTAPSEDSVTITQVTGSPTTRGNFVKIKYSWIEDNPFSLPDYMSMASMRAAIDAEATEVLATLVAAATNATGQWFNANSGAVITAGTGTSGNDDTASMTQTLTSISKAKNALDVQGYGPQGPYIYAMHPKNYNEFIISSGISTYAQQGIPTVTTQGIINSFLGVQLVEYDQVAAQDNTTNDTYQNIMFVPNQAFALGVGREVTIKAEEHSELQQLYWTATHRIIAKVLDNKAWCRISAAQ